MQQSGEMVVHFRRPHRAQLEVLASAKRFNVLMCGRRWGKTELIKEVLIKPALAGYPTGYFTPSYKLLIEVWDGVLWALGNTVLRSNATERRVELKTGGVIEMWTLDDPDAGRSRKYKAVVIDEAQKIDNLLSKWRLAIRPTLLD
jgi:phage terminase large subunit-like protein